MKEEERRKIRQLCLRYVPCGASGSREKEDKSSRKRRGEEREKALSPVRRQQQLHRASCRQATLNSDIVNTKVHIIISLIISKCATNERELRSPRGAASSPLEAKMRLEKG